jgi:N-acetylmuramoyl-L-alanine amidase
MTNRGRLLGLILIFIILYAPGDIQGQERIEKLSCICIDPGHGGKDPGAINGKVKEKDITLDVSLKLGELIRHAYPGIKIIYTRKKDVSVDVRNRGEIANKAKAQLFISIHMNSVSNSAPNGTEVFVQGLHVSEASLQVAMRENSAIHYEADYSTKYGGFAPDNMESYILFNHLQNTFLNNSLTFAKSTHDELVKAVKTQKRGVKQAGFLVLKDVAMPSVLIEMGFISNAGDLKKFTSTAGKENAARSIFKAFVTYKDEVESNSILIQNTRKKQEENQELVYTIQIASAKSRITNFKRFNLQYPVEELKLDDRYCYHVRACSSYSEAEKNRKEIREKVKDCFIIAIHNGKLIPVARAKQIENEREK